MTKINELLVSVVIPTYNRTEYFNEALQSVLAQTYKNIEIIVVDDNVNKPEVRRFVEGKVANIPQCILVQNEKNLGGALNRNEGIKHSNGELVSFLDDDDTYEPTRIEKVVEMYKNHDKEEIGVIYTYCYRCDKDMKKVGEYRRKPTSRPLFQHMCNCLCATSQWTIPKRVFEKVGMFEQSPSKQDSILLLKILGNGYKVLCVEEPLSNFRSYDGERISRNVENHVKGENNLLYWQRKYYDQLSVEEQNKAEISVLRRLMYNQASLRRILESFKLLWKIFQKEKKIHKIAIDAIIVILSPQLTKRLFSYAKRCRKKDYTIVG